MKTLKERILKDGKCLEGGILKVDSFINHQMDPLLMMQMAKELADRFSDKEIDKIITIEASGIAPAIMVAYIMQVPVVFAKKKIPSTMDGILKSEVFSFTKRERLKCSSRKFSFLADYVVQLISINVNIPVFDLHGVSRETYHTFYDP